MMKKANAKRHATIKQPRTLAIAATGIRTSHDFARVMSALMSDLLEGRLPPSVGNATCNAGGKLLKVVEMQHKYGKGVPGSRVLALAPAAEDA